MARDNTDQIPIEDIQNPKGKGYNLAWRRKDKMRGITWDGSMNTISWERVSGWEPRKPPGMFGRLFFVRNVGPDGWLVEEPEAAELQRNRNNEGIRILIDIDPGETIGYFIATPTVRAAIRTWTRPGSPPPPPGDKVWPFNNGQAPIVVMSPTGTLSNSVWDAWLAAYARIVEGPGWDGTHTPIQNMWNDRIRALVERNESRGLVSAFWLVDQTDSANDATEMLEHLISQVGWARNVVIGPTYDVQENWSTSEVDAWVGTARSMVPAGWMVGARALPDRRYAGDFAAWEDHVENLAEMNSILDGEIARSDGRPCWNTERFRVRNQPADDNKDWREADLPEGIGKLRAKNVGAIFGIQDARGSVSDYGCGGPTSSQSESDIRAALGATVPPPTEGKVAYLIDDHRNARIKIAEASTWGDYTPDPKLGEFMWEGQGAQQQEIEIGNSQPWVIHTIWYFSGVDRGWAEETTIMCELKSPGGSWREVCVYVEEKEGAVQQSELGHRVASRHNAEKTYTLGEPVILPPGSKLRVTAWHSIHVTAPMWNARSGGRGSHEREQGCIRAVHGRVTRPEDGGHGALVAGRRADVGRREGRGRWRLARGRIEDAQGQYEHLGSDLLMPDWRLHLWSSLALLCLGGGIAGFFLFDLIALRDPEAMTVSQELREFLTWGWESYLLIFGFTAIIVIWFFAHLLNPESP